MFQNLDLLIENVSAILDILDQGLELMDVAWLVQKIAQKEHVPVHHVVDMDSVCLILLLTTRAPVRLIT